MAEIGQHLTNCGRYLQNIGKFGPTLVVFLPFQDAVITTDAPIAHSYDEHRAGFGVLACLLDGILAGKVRRRASCRKRPGEEFEAPFVDMGTAALNVDARRPHRFLQMWWYVVAVHHGEGYGMPPQSKGAIVPQRNVCTDSSCPCPSL